MPPAGPTWTCWARSRSRPRWRRWPLLRFRHARGVERQQLQSLTLAAALTGLSMMAAAVLIAAGRVGMGAWPSVIGVIFLPLATGAAILRYRLYDLDRIISRTVAYGLLTLLLGLGYAGVVLGLGRLLPQGSSLVVAAAPAGPLSGSVAVVVAAP